VLLAEHMPARVSDVAPLVQMAVEQAVPGAYFWQPPVPSHLPLVPQLAAPWSVQEVVAVPAATGEHIPALVPTLQA
jgi:hypothetical protein